jgi:UDP-GlcNAc:undecaprenyl-phosphate GlcNAc-1-phosphate transferase
MPILPAGAVPALVLVVLVTVAGVAILARLAPSLGLVDHPGGRRDHAHPIPLVGGLAIFLAMAASFALFGQPQLAYIAGATLLVGVGALDDVHKLRVSLRLGAQIIAAIAMIVLGGVELRTVGDLLGHGPIGLWIFIFPMTIFAVVGVINSLNMIDGMDGLGGGVAFIALLWYAAVAYLQGMDGVYLAILLHAAAVAAFLAFNLRLPGRSHARAFLGDAGSTLLGFLLGWLAVDLTQGPGRSFPPICALWVVLLPLADCVSLMSRRIKAGRSPFAADSRHIHHYLQARGLSWGQTLAVLLSLSVTFGAVGFFGWRMGVPQHYLFWAFFCLYFGYHFWIQRAWKVVEPVSPITRAVAR